MSCSPLPLSHRVGGSYHSPHTQNAAHQNTLELVFGRGVSSNVLGRSTDPAVARATIDKMDRMSTDLMAMARQTGRTDLAIAAHAVAARTREYATAVHHQHSQLGGMFGGMQQMQDYQRGSHLLLHLLMQGRGL